MEMCTFSVYPETCGVYVYDRARWQGDYLLLIDDVSIGCLFDLRSDGRRSTYTSTARTFSVTLTGAYRARWTRPTTVTRRRDLQTSARRSVTWWPSASATKCVATSWPRCSWWVVGQSADSGRRRPFWFRAWIRVITFVCWLVVSFICHDTMYMHVDVHLYPMRSVCRAKMRYAWPFASSVLLWTHKPAHPVRAS